MKKYLIIPVIFFLASSCEKQCKVCKVIKGGEMIEKYESCSEDGKKVSESICDEMAKLQKCDCKCQAVEMINE